VDKISGVFQTARGGMQSSRERLDSAARKVALEASAAVVQRADDMLGTLLDALV
jgi:hypothetical protein